MIDDSTGSENSLKNSKADIETGGQTQDIFAKMSWDWCISGSPILKKNLLERLLPNVEGRSVNINKFVNLLASSLSLNFEEKKRVINKWRSLSQEQCDELQLTFEDERREFNKLMQIEKGIILKFIFFLFFIYLFFYFI